MPRKREVGGTYFHATLTFDVEIPGGAAFALKDPKTRNSLVPVTLQRKGKCPSESDKEKAK